MIPDQRLFASGGNTRGQILNLAARHQDGRWALIYLGGKSEVSIRMDLIGPPGKVNVFWVDPRSGKQVPVGKTSNTGTRLFSPPEDWEDALLVVEA